MNIQIPETETNTIIAKFATGEPRNDIVTYLIRTDEIKKQISDGDISRARKVISDQLRSYDPTDRRFADKYREKYISISEAIQAEFQDRIKAFANKQVALLQKGIEEREELNDELGGALEDYLDRDSDNGGFEIADPQEAITVINAIEKNRRLNIDDTEKLSNICVDS